MLTLLWKAISGNRLITYAAFILTMIAVVAAAYTTVKRDGASEERSKQLQDALSSLQREYKHRAEIDRLAAEDARRLLKERWQRL